MGQENQGRTPWVAIFGGLAAMIVFLHALDRGLFQAALMGAVAFVIVFVPIGLLDLALERWRR